MHKQPATQQHQLSLVTNTPTTYKRTCGSITGMTSRSRGRMLRLLSSLVSRVNRAAACMWFRTPVEQQRATAKASTEQREEEAGVDATCQVRVCSLYY